MPATKNSGNMQSMRFPRLISENLTNSLFQAQSCERCVVVDRAFLQFCEEVVKPFGCFISFQDRGYSNGRKKEANGESNFPCSSSTCEKFKNCHVCLGLLSIPWTAYAQVCSRRVRNATNWYIGLVGHSTLQPQKHTRCMHTCVVLICHHVSTQSALIKLPTEVQQISSNVLDPSFAIHSYINHFERDVVK